jgi:hypothetical protein
LTALFDDACNPARLAELTDCDLTSAAGFLQSANQRLLRSYEYAMPIENFLVKRKAMSRAAASTVNHGH